MCFSITKAMHAYYKKEKFIKYNSVRK
jgi:hypothetical protein